MSLFTNRLVMRLVTICLLITNFSLFGFNGDAKFFNNNKASFSFFNVGGVISSGSATCANNGEVIATANGGVGSPELYIFTLTSGPTANGQVYPTADYYDASTFTFEDLYPGTYQVTIEDANDLSNPPFIQTIQVLDETENLNFSLTPENPNCPGASTGSIEVNVSTGIGPYQYQIFSGPTGTATGLITDANPIYTFNGLPAGNYNIRVYDVCGDFQTRSYLLSDPTLTTLNLYTSGNPHIELISCTEAIYKVGAAGGTGSGTYTYEVLGGAPSGYVSSQNHGAFTLPINQAPYTFQVTDGCGQTATHTYSNPSAYLQWSAVSRDCSGWSLQIRTNWMFGPFTYTLTNVPSGYSGPMSNSTGAFDIPYGYVSYTVTDACGVTRSGSTTRTQEPIDINETLTNPTVDYCVEGKGRVQVRYNNSSNGAVGPVSFELTTVPAGFTGDSGPQGGSTFDELTPGNYVVTGSDACGNSDTHAFEIVDVLNVDVATSFTLNCVNSNSIEVNVTSNNSYHNSGTRRYRLRNANTNALVQSGTVYGSAPSTYTFNNLIAGDYYVEYYASSSCTYPSETVTISAYEQPSITPLSSYDCGAGFVTISGVITGGTAPYTFTLINNANNQVIATHTDCYFSNQDASLSYSVRIEDSCGNTTSSQVSSVNNGLGLVFQNETCGVLGEGFPIYLRNYRGMTYSWTFPDGTTYSGNDPRSNIGVLGMNDFGTYTVDVSTADGCRTQTLSTNFERCPLPPIDIDFDGVDDYLDATPFITNWTAGTIMGWVKIEHTSSGYLPNQYSIAGQENMRLYITSGRTPAFYVITQDQITASSNYPSNNIQVQPDPLFNVEMQNDLWYHVAGVFNSVDQTVKLYLNGELVGTETDSDLNSELVTKNFNGSPHIYSKREFTIGRYPTNTSVAGFGHFNGNIDEVRVFDTALTDNQIQQMVYQEIENNSGHVRGTIIPKDIQDLSNSEKVSWSNLQGYYPMTDIVDSKTIDYSTNANDATLHNITTVQEQTAPMPYATINDGAWTTENTWLHGDVWDITDTASNKDWSIIKIEHDLMASHDIKTLGLFIDSDKTLNTQGDHLVQNSWYLELNGTLDLEDDSQLVQTSTSDLVTSSTGKILRRQEGTASPYWYNYWSSPVGTLGATSLIDNNTAANNPNNTSFSLNMLKDESGFDTQFTSGYTGSNSISTYWLYTFKNGLTYWDWVRVSTSTALQSGVGYTQKGTGTVASEQQYIFEGKPNNGTILIDVDDVGGTGSLASVSKTDYLLGNPYPSALNIHKFIDDNEGVIKGFLQLWQQWSGSSHNLSEYNGGYAQVNKTGTVRASQFVGLEGDDTDGKEGTKIPTKYLPIGQGFIVEIEDDGDLPFSGKVEFNNSQRAFILESDADATDDQVGSVFSKTEKGKKTSEGSTSKTSASTEEAMQKIRLEFNSTSGPATRQELLLGFSEFTTDGYDYGYDAENSTASNNDLNLDLDGKNMNIQAYASITADKVVPLNFSSSGDNAFEISISETNNLEEDQVVYLRDNLTGTYFNLREDTAYGFTSEQGIFNDRFAIVFQSEQQSLSTEESKVTENHVYYQNSTNTLYVKKLNSDVSKLSLVNMRGQLVLELQDVSREQLENGLQFNNMSAGAYVVYMQTNTNEVLTKKIIVK
ncbi:LamG-like jellyroll fold domain-containing protein [Algibacter sp. R77976]|uniref:LamG-like jellyroll fold domain-containing protein n=1 Tax=Algibacter sp. R77976 TaxID=3093873 RepID=UPI0037CA51C8